MSLSIILRPAAREAYDRAIEWYENQQAGLGGDFEHEIERILTTIAAHPKRYPVVHRDTQIRRRCRFVGSPTVSTTGCAGVG